MTEKYFFTGLGRRRKRGALVNVNKIVKTAGKTFNLKYVDLLKILN